MKLFQWRSRRTQPPVWALEKTDEIAIIECEANALIAENRSHAWASTSTGLLRNIRAGLHGS